VKTDDNSQLPKTPEIPIKLENPNRDDTKEPELLKTIEKLKGELAEKDKQLKSKDSEISLLTSENKKLQIINQEKDQKLKELQEKVKEISKKNSCLIENFTNLKNTVKKPTKNPANNNQIQVKTFKEKNNLLATSEKYLLLEQQLGEQTKKEKLVAEIQVWKPPN
jgi:hypothetical protein